MRRIALVCSCAPFLCLLTPPPLASTQATGESPADLLAELPEPAAQHVVLISIDGLRPEFYLDASWPAPTLQDLARKGIHAAAVRPAFPSVTFTSHTTMVTGEAPAAHGIFHNRTRDQPGPVARWYWHADSIRVPTLWDQVGAAGGTIASLWWPVTVGADIDWNLPVPPLPEEEDRTRVDMLRQAVHPPELLDELEANATGRLTEANFENGSRAKEDRLGSIAAYLIETRRPTLTLVHIVTTDDHQHQYGREHLEVRRAVASADRVVSRILEALEAAGIHDNTVLAITGDHGFVDVERTLAPNVWLRDANLLADDRDDDAEGAWFRAAGGSALLYAKGADDAVLTGVEQTLATLPDSIREAFQVVSPAGLARVGAEADVRLALSARPGYLFTDDVDVEPISDVTTYRGTHGHFSFEREIHTGFIGYGPGVPSDTRIEEMSLEDVAPFLLKALGAEG